ncbi:MAG: ATP-binding cassette domain-containing protein [Saprospirales bacterium]|nr:MAG: ATP-binding cassette domain-containing protein [Saprospirales bacterium]
MILKTANLSRNYGPIKALNQLNLQVNQGEILGLLGPNGSGKTTTLALVLGILHRTDGNYEWFEGRYNNPLINIGSILENPNFYGYMSGWDNMQIIQKIRNVKEGKLQELSELVGLKDRIHSRVKTYSLGMKQRLAIACSLIGDPEVLIFDEPTNGLDPQGIADIRNLILQIAGMNKTIIMASHILSEVEKICTHTAILNKGKLIASGPVSSILQSGNTFVISSSSHELLAQKISEMPGFRNMEKSENQLTVNFKEGVLAENINTFCLNNGIVLSGLVKKSYSLEDAFLKLLSEQK